MTDQIDHPAHYQAVSDIGRPILEMLGINPELLKLECIDAVDAVDAGRMQMNAMKYLWRAGLKGDLATDLQKARWYLERWQQQPRLCGQGKHVAKAIAMIDQILNNKGEDK